ncbi:hypothetical protein HU200_007603 [Digitaria exilis]|uniref:Uncharacterized protein n=1 Tax=Digitaria exilis TaxID=1010633 RepID=A0A835KQU7_9POAL|nr:hypothetical protein HU200_007603 [Digitaria exilis]
MKKKIRTHKACPARAGQLNRTAHSFLVASRGAAPPSTAPTSRTGATDGHVRRLLNRVSIAMAAVATAALLQLFRHSSSSSCVSSAHASSLSLAPFPRTSCDAASRRVVDPDLRLAKLRASPRWIR